LFPWLLSRLPRPPRSTLFPYTTLSRSGFAIQLAHQRGTPGVPQVRVGGVDVGNGQGAEVVEVHQVADLAGKFMHHVRIRNILALDRKSTRLNSSHVKTSYAVSCLKTNK